MQQYPSSSDPSAAYKEKLALIKDRYREASHVQADLTSTLTRAARDIKTLKSENQLLIDLIVYVSPKDGIYRSSEDEGVEEDEEEDSDSDAESEAQLSYEAIPHSSRKAAARNAKGNGSRSGIGMGGGSDEELVKPASTSKRKGKAARTPRKRKADGGNNAEPKSKRAKNEKS